MPEATSHSELEKKTGDGEVEEAWLREMMSCQRRVGTHCMLGQGWKRDGVNNCISSGWRSGSTVAVDGGGCPGTHPRY